MNVSCLIKELDKLGVPKRRYSINGSLMSDINVLNEVYGKWEYFYFDEKGQINDLKKFDKEDDACDFFYEILKKEMQY